MGFEALTIIIESEASRGAVISALQELDFVQLPSRPQDDGGGRFEHLGANFIVEASVSNTVTGCTKLKIAEGLCNPPVADTFFSSAITRILSLAQCQGRFMTALTLGLSFSSAQSMEHVASLVIDQAVGLRAKWQKAFGNKTGAVRVADSYAFVGLKK